ncbi:LysM peptidoglycan-binding domain-containing protein [Dehalobacterium formicoaceticum]|uniref:LysM peptidoglycan-binding domain-containing protein n=1 Tax=Dehalobacterium formicoaceticum TaxID=51515 RepID=UPI0031F720FA
MKIYFFKPGDTLYNIAQRFHTTVEELLTINKNLDLDRIFTYQPIMVPQYATARKTAPTEFIRTHDTPPLPQPEFGSSEELDAENARSPIRTYVVQPGDTLYTIAQRFGTTVNAIVTMNNIQNPDMIAPGLRLFIFTPGPTPSPTPAPTPTPTPRPPRTYIVQPGDTLYAIALRFGTTVDAIVNLNNIEDPDMIAPGQRLRIPQPTPTPSPTPTPTPTPRPPRTYIVRSGDTLYAIALRFGTTVDAIVDLNNIEDPDMIAPGQSLLIPR